MIAKSSMIVRTFITAHIERLRSRRLCIHVYRSMPGRLACTFLLVATPVFAQVATGDILGTVLDTTGATIPGATVRIENTGTHEVRTAATKNAGEYIFSSLQPGTYTVTVTSANFKTFLTSNVVVLATDRVRIDAKLQAGAVEEQVEVTATPTALQTDNTTVGSTITERTLTDAPLNGRNYIALVQVQAGVNAGSSTSLSSGSNTSDRRLTGSISANGQQEIFNNNLVDGLDNNGRSNGQILLRPSVEAIGEVRTDINLYTAEEGRTGGAVINVITKSGANQFHGSAFEFFRNDLTDARNFFATSSILSRKPKLRQNQFGGSLSGPIVKDKTFFFVDYEGFRRTDGNNTVYRTSVPTAAQQADPASVAGVASISQLDPTALAYFRLFPLPNTGGPTATANNYLSNPNATLNSNVGDIRLDQHLSSTNTLFARYSYNRNEAYTPAAFPTVNGVGSSGVQQGVGYNNIYAHNGQLGYTHIFSPTLLMELKGGYTLFNGSTAPLDYGQNLNDQAPYKIPNANECYACSGLAPISVQGYSQLGDSLANPAFVVEHNTQFAGAVTYTRGRHTLKFGSSLIRRNFTFQGNIYPKGVYIFANLRNMLLGAPYVSARLATILRPYDRVWEPSGFIQDDWRATDHLTFNLGLRYDVFTKPNDKNGNFSNFDLGSLSLIQNGTGGIQNQYHDISPRIGFDATIGHGTVLRGGFGLSFFNGSANTSLVLANTPTSFSTGNVVNFTPLSVTGVAPIVPQSTATANLFGSVVSRPLHESDSYQEQFNLLLQKEYRGTVVTVGYVGELGRHLVDQVPNLNIPAPNGPYPGNVAAPPPPLRYLAQLPKVTTINYYGNFGASSYNSLQTSVERRISHGLTANINYTYAHNFDDLIAVFDGDTQSIYGFGDLTNQVGTYDYGNSSLDLRSRFAGFFSYDLPFGKSGSRLTRSILGGFRFNGLGFAQSGSAFTITSAVAQTCPTKAPCANAGLATINLPTVTIDRPNMIGQAMSGSAVAGPSFNLNAFAQQPYGTAGNEKRNQLFGPHLRRGDLSLVKNISVHERLKLELRAECINISNTPNFAKPTSTITAFQSDGNGNKVASPAGGFGQISNTLFGYSGRQFQFAGRFSF